MKTYITLWLWTLISTMSLAQSYMFSGIVQDANDGTPLIGANISFENKNIVTDFDGNFNIESKVPKLSITVSYVGYESKSITIDATVHNKILLTEKSTILETMTVTASKYEQRISESTVSIEVLKSDYISSTNANSAEDVLDRVPGLQMVDGQANIRGGSGYSYGAGSRVLLLLDDMPALQLDAGFPNWNDLPIEATEQIEIVKGAASALYGSSALNGIINLRRIKPSVEPRTELSYSHTVYSDPQDIRKKWYGDDHQPYGYQMTGMHARKFGDLDLMVHGLYRKLDSFNKDTYEDRYRLGFSASYRYNDRWLFSLSSVYNHTDNANFFIWANPITGIYTPFANSISASMSTRFNIDPSVKYFADNGDIHTLRSRFSRVDNDNNNDQGNTSNTLYGEYQYQTLLANDVNIIAGVALMHGTSDSELFGDTTFTADNHALYAQVEKTFAEKLGVTLGARYEYNLQTSPETFNGFVIPDGKVSDGEVISRLGLNYKIAEYSHLRASFGQGYRFPTITERFIVTSFSGLSIFPNPDLRPEKGWTAELGAKQGVRFLGIEGFVDFSLFYQRYEDMTEFIVTTINGTTGFQSQNIGGTVIKGGEVSVLGTSKIGPIDFTFFGGYTYIDPQYQDFNEEVEASSSSSDNVLKYRTKHNGKFDIAAIYKGASLGVTYNRTSHMLAVDSALELLGPPQIAAYRDINDQGYHLWNLRASYEYKFAKLSFLVNNIKNVEYTERAGKLEAPRNMTLRLDFKF